MDTPVVRLIIQAGLVPPNILQQLERWKLLPTEQAAAGSQEGSSALEWKGAEDFVQALERLIREENLTIRESEFSVVGDFKKVWLWGHHDGHEVVDKLDAVVDKMGRVFLPASALGGAEINEVSFASDDSGHAAGPRRRVARTEPRYADQKEVAHVLYLEEADEAARAPAPAKPNGHAPAS